ncbi:hypothetical protein JP39_09160 [Companilactobacillus heilongjiangensis]|uniref:Uncharacterized protein n=1 Tax=Companilactobacillus heilongjiangensis TaxID=1074467 RepID=A0A0K2LE82_9LACO|nr:hypothetical protein JP39_09160 [Companilactobacillus heilongjiangensis]
MKFANCAKFKIEVRDRTLARLGPHSGLILLSYSSGKRKKQKKKQAHLGGMNLSLLQECVATLPVVSGVKI